MTSAQCADMVGQIKPGVYELSTGRWHRWFLCLSDQQWGLSTRYGVHPIWQAMVKAQRTVKVQTLDVVRNRWAVFGDTSTQSKSSLQQYLVNIEMVRPKA